jgi:hypothetical protein
MKLKEMIEDEKESLGSPTELVGFPSLTVTYSHYQTETHFSSHIHQESTFKLLSSTPISRPSPSANPLFSSISSSPQERSDEEIRLIKSFRGMELKSSIKVTQDRVYSMVVHPMKVSDFTGGWEYLPL